MAAGSGAVALLGTGMLPALGGILLSLVIGMYVRRFLVNRLYNENKTAAPARQSLEWEFPTLSPVQEDVWRASLTYPSSSSAPVRQMLRDALKKQPENNYFERC